MGTLKEMQESQRLTTVGILQALRQFSEWREAAAGDDGNLSEALPAALRKLQERDPEFPPYDGNPENFLQCIVAVEVKNANRKIKWRSPSPSARSDVTRDGPREMDIRSPRWQN